jgi:hypothetical protein
LHELLFAHGLWELTVARAECQQCEYQYCDSGVSHGFHPLFSFEGIAFYKYLAETPAWIEVIGRAASIHINPALF